MDKKYAKDFDGWNGVKKRCESRFPLGFNERDIWWCAVGVNVGSEICGKGSDFARPVLVLQKYGRDAFFGIPMARKGKNTPGYYAYQKDSFVVFRQARCYSAKRLLRRKGVMRTEVFSIVEKRFSRCISGKNKKG